MKKRFVIWLLRLLGAWPIVVRIDRVVVGRYRRAPSGLWATVYGYPWTPRLGILGGMQSSGLHKCEERKRPLRMCEDCCDESNKPA